MDCRSGWMCAWMGECMWVWGGGSECECVIEYTHIRDLSNMPGTFVFTVGQPGEMNPLWGPQKKPVRGRTQMSFPFKPRGLRSQSRLHQHQLLPSSFVSLRHWCSDVSDTPTPHHLLPFPLLLSSENSSTSMASFVYGPLCLLRATFQTWVGGYSEEKGNSFVTPVWKKATPFPSKHPLPIPTFA